MRVCGEREMKQGREKNIDAVVFPLFSLLFPYPDRQKLEIMVTSRGVSISTSPPLSIPAPTGCLAQKNKTIKIPVWFCVFLEVSEGRGP